MTRESPPGDWTTAGRRPLALRSVALVALIALASPFAAFSAWNRIEAARIATRIAAIERAGQPLRSEAPAASAPETAEQKRASRLYADATRLMRAHSARQFLGAGAIIRDLAEMPGDLVRRDPRLGTLTAEMAEHADVLALLNEATPLDARGFAPGDAPAYPLEERRIASPNAVRIAHLAFFGDGEGAARALFATLRLRRMSPPRARRSALTTAHSLELVLSSGAIPRSVLAQIQQEYAALAADLDVEQRLLDDRAAFLGSMLPRDVQDLSPSGSTVMYRPRPFEALAYRLLSPARRHAIVAALDDYAEALEAARVPWPGKLEAADALLRDKGGPRRPSARRSLFQQASAPWGRNVGSSALAGAVGATAEGLALSRSALAAIAVARYRLDHAGRLPPGLAALVPQYMASVPEDPFSGSPLRYLHDGSSWKVYSVGRNRKDDGGAWYATSDLLPRRGEPADRGIAVRYTDRPTR